MDGHPAAPGASATPRGAPRSRQATQILGAGLFIGGLVIFALGQTQELLRNSFDFAVSANVSGRNDGGLLLGALIAGTGLATLAATFSHENLRPRLIAAATLGLGTTVLTFLHFTIFVNSLTLPGARLVALRASFLFHDAADYIPIALFILMLVTFLLLAAITWAILRLVAPSLLQNRIMRPTHQEDHRARLLVIALLVVATGMAFVRQFLDYALAADRPPANGDPALLDTNMALVYYLMSLALLLAVGAVAHRTWRMVWGDMRAKRSLTFQRSLVPIRQTETWLLGFVAILTGAVFLAAPVVQPESSSTSVFAVNSRGTSFFLLLMLPLYYWQRRAEHRWLHWLRYTHRDLGSPRRWDRLALFTAVIGGGWLLLALVTWGQDLEPLTSLATRLVFVALAAPWFAIRFAQRDAAIEPHLRGPGSLVLLLTASIVAILAGLMLWGQGNSLTTFYSTNGGFIVEESSILQPYSTGIRLLASILMAAPLTLLAWFQASRFVDRVHPGPILVLGFSIVIALNLLFTINTGDPTDTLTRQAEVIVGFYLVDLATTADKLILLGLWIAVVAIGCWAALRLVRTPVATESRTEG